MASSGVGLCQKGLSSFGTTSFAFFEGKKKIACSCRGISPSRLWRRKRFAPGGVMTKGARAPHVSRVIIAGLPRISFHIPKTHHPLRGRQAHRTGNPSACVCIFFFFLRNPRNLRSTMGGADLFQRQNRGLPSYSSPHTAGICCDVGARHINKPLRKNRTGGTRSFAITLVRPRDSLLSQIGRRPPSRPNGRTECRLGEVHVHACRHSPVAKPRKKRLGKTTRVRACRDLRDASFA